MSVLVNMSKSRVFVIGASGNVGKATVTALSKNYGEKLDIRAGARNPDKVAEFQSLQGVTVVRAEMGKRDELIEIFKDLDVLFIVVPGSDNRVELSRVTAEAAKEADVKHIISIGSTPGPRLTIGQQMLDIDSTITSLGINYTILGLPWFMENYFMYKETVQKSSLVCDTIDPNKRFPAVCMDDLGFAAALIMSSPEKHAGKKYFIVSDRHSFSDLVKGFSEALGKDVKYIQQSYEDVGAVMLQNGLTEKKIEGLVEYWKAVNAGEFEEGTINDFTAITGKQPTSVASWVKRYASVFK